jgi:hypothetical protein
MLWNGETGAWLPIAGGIPAARGEYTWRVPPGLCGRMFRIKVQSEEGGAYAMTGSYFFIEPPERSASAARRLPGDAMWLR